LKYKTANSPSDNHKFAVARLDVEILVDIYGEQRTGAVEYRGEVTHQCSQHHR